MKLAMTCAQKTIILSAFLTITICNLELVFSQELDRSRLRDDQIVSIEISPGKETVPALKHQLFPLPGKMVKRNAAIYYHRAIKIASMLPRQPDFGEDSGSESDSYSLMHEAPLSELQLGPIKDWIAAHEPTLRELARAERSSECDWGLMPDDFEAHSWFEAMLPELQEMRGLARMLVAKARVEMAEGRLSDAMKTMRLNYKMAADLGESDVLIGDLIGIAIVGITNAGMYELIQQPGCPSLYWPLVSMPNSIVDTRAAILNELNVILKGGGFGILDDPESKQRSVQEWKELYFADALRMHRLINSRGNQDDIERVKLSASMILTQCYPIAKKALIDSGMNVERVEAMPVVQVVAIHQSRQNQVYHDEMAKVVNLPLNEAAKRIESSLDGNPFENTRQGMLPYLNMLLPACQQVMSAQARIESRMAALKVIEAIRLHLAEKGELPEKLDDITVVPVPLNPSFNEPFQYEKTETGATLLEKTMIRPTWQLYEFSIAK